MENQVFFENLPVSIYVSKFKIFENSFEMIDFKLIHNAKFSGYDINELDVNTILSSLDKNDLKEVMKLVKETPKNGTFTVKYHFKAKNGKTIYLKDYIRILDVKDNIYTFLGVVTDVSKEAQLSDIFETIIKSPILGVLIHKEKIVLANDTVKKIFEIGDKIYDLNIVDLFPDFMKPIAKETMKKRLKGEKITHFHAFELETYKNRRIYAEFFSETIYFDGGCAGLIFVVDKTKFYKDRLMIKILSVVNSLIATINNEKVLLEEIKNKLNEIECFSDIRLDEKLDLKEIEINNECKKGNYKSYMYLPIVVNGEVIASYSFYSRYKDDFDEKVISTLKDVKQKIEFAIKSLLNRKNLIILNNAVDKSFQWLIITDKNGKIIYANDAVEEISGYKKEEIIGKNPKIFKSDINNKEFYKNLWETITKGQIFNDIIINRKKNGELFYLKDKIIPVKIDDEIYYVSLGVDITKEKVLEEEIISVRYTDKLTGLYNRNGFLYYGQKKLKKNKKFALFIIDIEDFKLLNEIRGFKYGDLILEEFAKFLKDIFYSNDLIARLGNDDFAVLMEFNNLKMLSSVISKLLEKIKQKKEDLPININIGISLYPKDASNIEELVEKAYIALSFNKKIKQTHYKFYNENISCEIGNYMKVKALVDEAIEKNQFIFYFQPYVDAEHYNICGVESLLRIKDKEKVVTPNIFIDYVEKSGIIKKIENLMIKQLVKNIEELQIPISFNLSGISLQDENHIKKLVEISKNCAEFITIEITERELIEDLSYTKKMFEMFKQTGYKIAIDDFGTGYSSLSYISNLPVDVLKIDISFIQDIDTNKKNFVIVDTIINFAKKLNLKTVAEGVERKEQIKILKELGCDYLQGYYFYKPMPFNEFKKVLN